MSRDALESDLADAAVIQLMHDVALTVRLLELHPLRAADAIHVASAVAWSADNSYRPMHGNVRQQRPPD